MKESRFGLCVMQHHLYVDVSASAVPALTLVEIVKFLYQPPVLSLWLLIINASSLRDVWSCRCPALWCGSRRLDTRPVQPSVLHQNAPRGHLQLTSVRPVTSGTSRGTRFRHVLCLGYDVSLMMSIRDTFSVIELKFTPLEKLE
jgi:hypothetical protein